MMVDAFLRRVRGSAGRLGAERPADLPRATRPRAAVAGWTLSALAAAFGGLGMLLDILNHDPYPYWLAGVVLATIYPYVGALIVSRQPRHALGWLLCLIGLGCGLGRLADGYAAFALVTRPGSVPGGAAAAWIGVCAGNAGYLALPLLPLLFPDGRLPSPRWRPVASLWIGAFLGSLASLTLAPGPLENHPSIQNPLGSEAARTLLPLAERAILPIMV